MKILHGFFISILFSFNVAYAQSLKEIIAAGQLNDPAIISATEVLNAADDGVFIALSHLLPQLSYQNSTQKIDQTSFKNGSNIPNNFIGDSYTKQLVLRQSIFRAREFETFSQSKLQFIHSKNKYDSILTDYYKRVAVQWFDLLFTYEILLANKIPIESAQNAVKQELKKFKLGESTNDTVLESQSQLRLLEANLLDSQFSYQSKLDSFKLLTGVDIKKLPKCNFFNNSIDLQFKNSGSSLWPLVQEFNSDLMAAKIIERINYSRFLQAAYDHLPTVDFLATKTLGRNDSVNMIGTKYENYQVGLQIQMPLFAGWGTEATRRQSYKSYLASMADSQGLIQKLQTQLTFDLASLAGLRDKIAASQQSVEASIIQRNVINAGAKVGLRTASEISSIDAIIARRVNETINLQSSYFRAYINIISLFPVDHPMWYDLFYKIDLSCS